MAGEFAGLSPYSGIDNSPIFKIDLDGKAGRIKIEEVNGKIVLTFQTALHILGEVTEQQLDNLNAKISQFNRRQSYLPELKYKGKPVQIKYDIKFTAESGEVEEGVDNYIRFSDTQRSHGEGAVFYIHNYNPETFSGDIVMSPGNFLDVSESELGRFNGSSRLLHEILHLFGIWDRYYDANGVSIPDPGFGNDVMGTSQDGIGNIETISGILDEYYRVGESGELIINNESYILNKNVTNLDKKENENRRIEAGQAKTTPFEHPEK